METLQHLMVGFGVALSPTNLLIAAIGALIGTVVGLLPGLGPINGVAILMPLAFAMKLPPEASLILLAAVYIGCEYGGRISSILLNVPGDAGAIMTALDGYPMARKGLGGVALSISAWSSFVGSLIATVGIVLFAPLLASWALSFGPAEYFALMCFAFACIAGLMGDAPMKAALAAVIGLSLSCVGLDSNSGVYRFTGGDVHLSDGIQFIVVVIGVFSISEILLMLQEHHSSTGMITNTGRKMFNLQEMAQTWWGTVRSSVVGFIVGVLPGAGATIASAMTYSMEKRLTDKEGSFGKGDIRGVAGPEAANNAGAQTSFIPMLTLGIPPNAVMALMVGAMTIKGIQPGPQVMTSNPQLFWGLIASMWVGNAMLIVLNLPLIGMWIKLLTVPYRFLFPAILTFCCIGLYTLNNSSFDVYGATAFGVIGYIFYKLGCEPAPLLLGFILGPMMEENLRRALLLSRGDWSTFMTRPLSAGLLIAAALMIVVVALPSIKAKRAVAFQEAD